MLKTVSQMRFDKQAETLEKQLDIFSGKISHLTSYQKIHSNLEKYSEFNTKIKNLNNSYNNIKNEIKTKKTNNKFDLEDKLRKYSVVKDKISNKYILIGKQMDSINRAYLLNNIKPTSGDGNEIEMLERKNRKNANELMARYNIGVQDLEQTNKITQDALHELNKQGDELNKMKDELKEVETELGMADQLMRIIKNRTLVTKLLLVIMILLMGFVDVMLLALKII